MNVKTTHYKIVLFGVKSDTYDLYERFKEHVDLVITLDSDEIKNYHISGGKKVSDYIDKECFESNSYKLLTDECKDFFFNNSFDLGIVYGWQRIIPEYVLDRFSAGVFGFHASPLGLPFGKGRSPLNWSMILGFRQVYNHCFKYNKNVDDGCIYSTTVLDILPWDNIGTLRNKSLMDAENAIDNLIVDFNADAIKLVSQDPTKPESYFPKRTPKDGEIDLGKSTIEIFNLIRGVSHPFPGSYVKCLDNGKITIWDAHPYSYTMFSDGNYKTGDILKVFEDNTFLLKTVDGVLLVKDYSLQNFSIVVGDNLS